MPTHNVVQSYQRAGLSIAGTTAVTGDQETNADLVLAASSTNIQLNVALDVSQLQSLALYCTADCTVKTNSSSTPDDTVNLTGGQPVICSTNAEVIALIGTDVTALYLTCAAGGTFKLASLWDVTP